MNRLRARYRQIVTLLDGASPTLLVAYLCYVVITVFLLTQVQVIGGDSPPTVYLPVTLLRWGTFRLDPLIGQVPVLFDLEQHTFHYLAESNGHYYSKYSPVAALLALPLYALYLGLGGAPDNWLAYLFLSRVAATLIAAAITSFLFLALRRMVFQHRAFFLALVYAFGTFTWAFATNTLATQSSAELFLILAILAFMQLSEQPSGWRYALAGLWVGLAVAARLQVLVVSVFLTLYIARRGWGALWRFIGGALPVALLLIWYNIAAFGSPLGTGYGAEAAWGWSTPLWVGLPGILITPAHGLLMYSPVLLFAFGGGWVVWRRGVEAPMAQLGRCLSLASLAYLLLMSHWWAWHGGVAYNQRMLQEIHPLLILLVAYAWRGFGDSRRFRWALLAASLWPIWLNVVRVTFYDQHLDVLEKFDPAVVWSLRNCELLMYLRWHGVGGFLSGVGQTVLLLLAVTVAPTLLLFRLLRRGRWRV